MKKNILRILPVLFLLSHPHISLAAEFTCPAISDADQFNGLDSNQAKDLMYLPMKQGFVWGNQFEDRNPIVFQNDGGMFKIGYDYRAKECPREILLENETKPGQWGGKTRVHICSPAVAKLFEGAKDFTSDVWPKIQVMADQLTSLSQQKRNEYDTCNRSDEVKDILAEYQTASRLLNQFIDINGDGQVNAQDYEDTNGNGVADSGDKGVIQGKTWVQAKADFDQAEVDYKAATETCNKIYAVSREYIDKARSLLGLQLATPEQQQNVKYETDASGNLLPQFTVPLTSFHYERTLYNDRKKKQFFKACIMRVIHKFSYGGLASQYTWDFNYGKAYTGQTWSYNSQGQSVQDKQPVTTDLENMTFLDLDATEFVALPTSN